ncbi:MAG TPA: hypothetical protein VMU95_11870 [Trebonia sp.]|nr:hypothetical protein [Trebonia sp.]
MRCDPRRGITRAALVLVALALAALGAGCGGSPAGNGSGTPTPQSGQQLFQVHLVADVNALDSGVLGYQAPATMPTGADATLIVEVTDVGKGAPGTASLPTGFTYARQDVPTGAIVGVSASCQGVTCGPDTPERQPVLTPGSTADWSWTLSAQGPGTAHVLLTAATYDQDTNIALHVTQPIDIAIAVTATPGYWVSQAGTWTKGALGFIGFGAIAGAVRWQLRRNRKKRRKSERKESTPADLKEPTEPVKES